MFDTVNFQLYRDNISEGNTFEILPYLANVKEQRNKNGVPYLNGTVFDYHVNIYNHVIFFSGSLCKSFFGNNIQTLTRQATQQAFEKLSDTLHTDLTAAKVTRLDVSTVIPTKRPPADYYHFLGTKPRFERVQSTPDTLYYKTKQRELTFYDKTKEATAKGVQIPDIWQNSNLFRYELRYKKHLNKQLHSDLTAAILYDEAFYYNVIQNWHNEFKKIQKLKEQSFMMDNITTPKEAVMVFFASLLQQSEEILQQSGQILITDFLNGLKAKKMFSDRKYYTRVKNDLNKILEAPKGTKSELIKELETAIFDIAKYAR